MIEYFQIYAAGMLGMAFFLALIGDNKKWWLDLLRIAVWPITLATIAGQVVRGFIRMVLP